MKKEIVILTALVAAALAIGLIVRAFQHSAAELPALPEEIELDTFREVVEAGTATVVDARTAGLFARGHVPGAINISKEEARAFDAGHPLLSKIQKGQQIVVYCSNIYCPDAEIVARALRELGYQKVSVYRDGILGWQKSGLALEDGRK